MDNSERPEGICDGAMGPLTLPSTADMGGPDEARRERLAEVNQEIRCIIERERGQERREEPTREPNVPGEMTEERLQEILGSPIRSTSELALRMDLIGEELVEMFEASRKLRGPGRTSLLAAHFDKRFMALLRRLKEAQRTVENLEHQPLIRKDLGPASSSSEEGIQEDTSACWEVQETQASPWPLLR
jgi:hypothetical protein